MPIPASDTDVGGGEFMKVKLSDDATDQTFNVSLETCRAG